MSGQSVTEIGALVISPSSFFAPSYALQNQFDEEEAVNESVEGA
jgi:hypothetical protein